MPISIDFLANVGTFLKGTDDAAGALEDVAGALDGLASDAQQHSDIGGDLGAGFTSSADQAERALDSVGTALDGVKTDAGTAGDQAGTKLAAGIQAGTDDAVTDVGKLKTSFADMAAAAKTEGSSAGTNLTRNIKSNVQETSDGVDGMKESVKGGLREIGGSFDGTWQGAAGGAQGVLAELGEGFGPIGALAGAVAGGALGMIVSGVEAGTEAADAQQEVVSQLAAEYIENGRTGKRSFDAVAQSIEDMATGADDNMPTLTELWADAQSAGADYADVVAAIASGDPVAIGKVASKVDDLKESHVDSATAAVGYGRASAAAAAGAGHATEGLAGKLTVAAANAKAAGRAQELAAAAGLTDYRLKTDLIGQLHDGYVDAAGAASDYIDEESGLFDVEKYLTAMEQRAQSLRDYRDTLATSKLSREARSFIESQGGEQAAVMMAGYKKATPAQRRALERIWETSGRAAAQSYGEALGDDLKDKTVRGPKVVIPGPDMSRVDAALRKTHDLRVVVGYYANTGRRIL